MRVFDQVWRYFRNAPRDAGAQTALDGGGAVVVDEPAPLRLADAARAAPDAELWFRPRGPRTLWSPRVTGASGLVDRDLYEHLSHILDDAQLELPRLPRVTQRAMQLVRDPDVCFASLAAVVRGDSALTIAVLRVANSPPYRGLSDPPTLESAFARLGLRTLASIVLTCSLHDLMRTGNGEPTLADGLWQRSLASAVITTRFAHLCRIDEGEALLLGLLHDVGSLAVCGLLGDYQKAHGRRVSRLLFDRLCVEWHERIGMRLAEQWELPGALRDVIAAHHGRPDDDDPLRRERLLVQVADCVCALLRYAPYVAYDFFELPCVCGLGLREERAVLDLLTPLPELIEERLLCYP